MNYRPAVIFSILLACLLLAVIVNVIYGIDIVYTHLFYIPIILTGIWYPRYVVFCAAALGLIHIACEYAITDAFKSGSLLRAVMFMIVAYVTGHLTLRRDRLLHSLRESEAALKKSQDDLEQRVAERTEELIRVNEELQTYITERKSAEEALRKSERKYRNIFEHAIEGIFQTTSDGRYINVNPAFASMAGYGSPDEMQSEITNIGEQLYINPEDRKRLLMLLQASEGSVREFETQIRRNDSTLLWISTNVRMVNNEAEKTTLLEGTCIDITERKQAEEALREIEERYKALFDSDLDLVYICDFEGRFIDANNAALNRFGYNREEIRSLNFASLFSEDQLPLVFKELQEIIETGYQKEVIELRLKAKNGDDLFIESIGSVIMHKGMPCAIQAIAHDITERKRTEQLLLEREEQYRTLVENIPDYVMRYDRQHRHIFANSKTFTANNMTTEEFIGKTHLELGFDPHLCEIWEKVIDKAFETGQPQVELFEWENAFGVKSSLEWRVSPERSPDGSIKSLVGISRDITERKQAEEKIQASLREKDILISEIHHRVKNNMQVISSLLSLQAKSSKNPEFIESFHKSQDRIQAMALVHEKLYNSNDFSRIGLAGYVRSLSGELFQSFNIHTGKIDLTIQTDGEVYVDINKAIPCGMILNELISNALKHAFPGEEPGELQIIIRETKNTEIEIVVRDNGLGLPDDVDIHEPRSLGLDLVNGLLKNQLDGQIEVRRDKGTEFRITFPL